MLQTQEMEIWDTVRQMNRTWAFRRDLDRLHGFFHPEMVLINQANAGRLEGAGACLADYERFMECGRVLSFEEQEPLIQFYGNGQVAVVTYYYQMDFEIDGQSFHTHGRELLVLAREEDQWQVVAQHFSPSSKRY